MKLRMKSVARFDVVEYSGTHGCSDDDHKKDQQVREYLAERVEAGQSRVLLDVRDIRVTYGSGIGDLLDSWAPAGNEGKGRLAVLSKPRPRPVRAAWPFVPAHWAHERMIYLFKGGVATSEPVRVGPLEMRFFADENEARAFLLAEE